MSTRRYIPKNVPTSQLKDPSIANVIELLNSRISELEKRVATSNVRGVVGTTDLGTTSIGVSEEDIGIIGYTASGFSPVKIELTSSYDRNVEDLTSSQVIRYTSFVPGAFGQLKLTRDDGVIIGYYMIRTDDDVSATSFYTLPPSSFSWVDLQPKAGFNTYRLSGSSGNASNILFLRGCRMLAYEMAA